MNTPSFQIITENQNYILIVDLDKGLSITNGAEKVIEKLNSQLKTGICDRHVYYRDTMGCFAELKTRNNHFAGFAPCSKNLQVELAQNIKDLVN